MAAHPKNKISSIERGKRRKGNAPKLNKDPKSTKVPLHRAGIFAQFKTFLENGILVSGKVARKEKKAARVARTNTQMTQQVGKPAAAPAPALKKTTRTQHKGA
jgi:hypothetical protein